MIRNTFSLLNGIGERLERRIWRKGVLTWEDFCRSAEIEGITGQSKTLYDGQLRQHSLELTHRNAEYFSRIMKRREHWRLFDVFGDGAVCLDIETNSLRPGYGGYVTVAGFHDGYDYTCLVKGENLSAETINHVLSGYKYLITFYGAAFDVPFLLKTFPGVRFDLPHFDLCFAARRLAIKGGLKKIEMQFGMDREDAVKGMNGFDAVKLWKAYTQGSAEARDLLIAYNREDTIHLRSLANILYQKLRGSTGIEEYAACGCA